MQTRASNFVPDAIGLASSAGWDTVKNQAYLTEMIQEFQRNGIRTSIFVDPRLDMIEGLNKRYRPNRTLYRSLCA
jgi:pyridoxine 5-phosphate synthase